MKIDIYEVDGQLTLLDPDDNEQIPVRRKSKRRPTLKDMMELIAVPIQVLDLTPGHGDLMGDARWEICPPFLADGTLLNTGVAPRKPIYASLSSILESHPDLKYYLSKTACLGILRRSDERNKELPAELKGALMAQSGLAPIQNMIGNLKAYHINQRDEGIDLGEVSGALMATSNMQMQTFITQPEQVVGFDGYNGDLTGDKAATLGVNCGMSTGRNGLIQPIVFAANQRDEVRNLQGVTGALQAQPGMKQQTFLAAAFSAGQGAKAGGIGYQEECTPTLKAAESGTNMVPSILCLNDQGGSMMECTEDMIGTLRAQEHGHQPLVFENHGIDSRYTGPHEVAPTMSSRYGTGGNNVPLVAQEEATVICIAGNTIDRQPQNGGNGFGYQEDISYTLTATDHHAVCQSYQDVVGSLSCIFSSMPRRF